MFTTGFAIFCFVYMQQNSSKIVYIENKYVKVHHYTGITFLSQYYSSGSIFARVSNASEVGPVGIPHQT